MTKFKGWSYTELAEAWDIHYDEYDMEATADAVAQHIDRMRGHLSVWATDEELSEALSVARDLKAFLLALAEQEKNIGFHGPLWEGLAEVYQDDEVEAWDHLGSAGEMMKLAIPLVRHMWS